MQSVASPLLNVNVREENLNNVLNLLPSSCGHTLHYVVKIHLVQNVLNDAGSITEP